jgi:hypothetical protein
MADATLTGANITFHTNDENKDWDTIVSVLVRLGGEQGPAVARVYGIFSEFRDHSDAGPFDLWLVRSVTRDELRRGEVEISIQPNGNDTWRFNFLLDFLFSDGAHLIARANGIELTQDHRLQVFGVE